MRSHLSRGYHRYRCQRGHHLHRSRHRGFRARKSLDAARSARIHRSSKSVSSMNRKARSEFGGCSTKSPADRIVVVGACPGSRETDSSLTYNHISVLTRALVIVVASDSSGARTDMTGVHNGSIVQQLSDRTAAIGPGWYRLDLLHSRLPRRLSILD